MRTRGGVPVAAVYAASTPPRKRKQADDRAPVAQRTRPGTSCAGPSTLAFKKRQYFTTACSSRCSFSHQNGGRFRTRGAISSSVEAS